MGIKIKIGGKTVRNPGSTLGRALHSQMLKAVEKALRSEGYKLKRDMTQAIKNNEMEWEPVKPLTLKLRKRYKTKPAPGYYFYRFIRYAVGKTDDGLTLKVGVFNPGTDMKGKKVKPLSRGIIANAERFARGFEFTADEKYRRARIKAFLSAAGVADWKELSKRRKKALKRRMEELGVFVRIGAQIKAPPRPADTLLEKNQEKIEKEINWLVSKALKGEKWSRKWWEEVKF